MVATDTRRYDDQRRWDEVLEDEAVQAVSIAFMGGTLDAADTEAVRTFVLDYLNAHGATLNNQDCIVKQ